MKNLLEFILIHIVTNPDAIVVEESEQDGEMLYSIRVHQDDIGRVIGKSGHVIQAIRTLAKVRAMKEGTRIRIVLVEDDRPATENVTVTAAETAAEVAPVVAE